MKNLLILLVLLVFNPVMNAQDQIKDQDRDKTRLMMVDGDLLQIRDRDQVQLKDNVTLNDGTVLSPNGSYGTREGEKLRLRDGECLDMDGVKYNNEYQYRFKVMQENKGLSQEQIRERNEKRTQFVAMDGQIFQIRNQEQNRLQNEMALGNGTRINPDGTYQTRDQKQLRLKDGECLNLDGQKYQNILQHRKMVMQKNMNQQKNINKPQMQPKVQKNVQKKTTAVKKKGNN
ncbi:hypothetical protein BC962_2189 [Gillisia mitskevichiae]|uniref:DUF6799 domain-containing protein n=1 Tax=Gillisia mitskevichiae TaxID=270921 RepID=A0A495PWI5_9FLAO|nr:DUF6799 domain-containing protein [Gillisia mitskevichiae]RKS53922.1 hypothetical protein BC962_2189 [Gillisia mitskevichiae]